jgi:hypothetical protein
VIESICEKKIYKLLNVLELFFHEIHPLLKEAIQGTVCLR